MPLSSSNGLALNGFSTFYLPGSELNLASIREFNHKTSHRRRVLTIGMVARAVSQ